MIQGRQINFYMCDLALSNGLVCNNCIPKMQIIENKLCNNHAYKQNITCMGACVCDPCHSWPTLTDITNR